MSRTLVIHRLAKKEMRKAYLWYKKRSVIAAARFREMIDDAMLRLAQDPSIHQKYLHGMSVYVLKRFPFFVVFWFDDYVIKLICVSHKKRKPGYWYKRLFSS